MKSFLRFAPVLALAFVFGTSCSRKDDVMPTASAACQVKKITTTWSSFFMNVKFSTTSIQTLEYDSENKLSKVTTETSGTNLTSSTIITLYHYTNGAITSVAAGTSSANWLVQDGRLVKVTQPGSVNVVDITYDGNGRLVKHQNTYAGLQSTYTAVYDANGNLKSDILTAVSSVQNDTESRTYAAYDSKINPYTIIADAMRLSYYFEGFNPGPFLPEALGQNNPGTSLGSHTDPAVNYSYDWNWSYTYDAKGYLTTSTQTTPGQSTTVRIFEYSHCD
jgi:YD repeat-containing protein